MADPKSLEQVGNYDDSDDLTEYARSRALRGEPMSPAAAEHTKGWEGLSPAQRMLRLNMLEFVDPNAAKEARGYVQAGFFGGAGDSTAQKKDPKPTQQGSVNAPEAPSVAGRAFDKAKAALQNSGLAVNAALGPANAALPFIQPMIQGAALRESIRRPALAENARDTAADAKTRMGGTMEAPPGVGQETLNADMPLPPPGGGGPQVIEAGIGTLHGSSRQTQQVQEDQQARQMRERATLLELGSAAGQAEADRVAAGEMLTISADRQAINERFRKIDEERAAHEAKVRADSERRIAEAEKAFAEAEPDPKWNPYQEVANGSWDKGILLGLGSMLGAVGASMTHGPDRFLEQFNAQIQRRVEAARDLRKHRGQVVQDRRDGYTRMLEALGSQRALDAMLEARAWRGLDARIEQIAAQHNWDSLNPKLQQVRAGILMKYREANMQAAKHVTEASQTQQAFRPMTVVSGGGGEDPMAKEIENVAKMRQEYKLPQIEAVLDNMNAAILGMVTDPSVRDQISILLSNRGHAGSITNALAMAAPFLSKNPNAVAAFQHAMNAYIKETSGGAVPEHEMQRLTKELGQGNVDALRNFYLTVDADRAAREQDVRAANPHGHPVFHARRDQGRATNNPASNYQPVRDPLAGGAPVNK